MASNNGNGSKSTALAKTSGQRMAAIRDAIENNRAMLVKLMPAHLRQNPDKLFRCVTSAFLKEPKLLDCTPASVVLAAAYAAVLGLEPNTPQQLAFIVPFKNQAQLIPGWRGLVRLARQSGEVVDMVARPVYANDEYALTYEPREEVIHKPFVGENRGETLLYYSRAIWADGRRDYEVMYPSEIDAIRARLPSKDSDAWVHHRSRMDLKTVTRRHCGRLPLSPERSEQLAKATYLDERQEAGKLTRGDVEDIAGSSFAPLFDEMTGEVIDEKDRGEELADKVGG